MTVDCYCDYDPFAVLKRVDVRSARKAHRCDECGRPIEVGEPYEYVFGTWDGGTAWYHTCPECRSLQQWVQAHVPCFCWAYTAMLQDARDTVDAYAKEFPELRAEFLRRLDAIHETGRPGG